MILKHLVRGDGHKIMISISYKKEDLKKINKKFIKTALTKNNKRLIIKL